MAYTIVSFCGGGIRGLMSAEILNMLVEQNPRILSHTNLLAGTSTGAGIISVLISRKCAEHPKICMDFLIGEYYAQAMFFRQHESSSCDPYAPAYPNTGLVKLLEELHGAATLSSLSQQVLLTAFNVGAAPVEKGAQGTPWKPLLLTNVPNAPVPTGDTTIVEAVVSSGSMPGMLPSYKGNVDGAFVHHDPTLAAIALAVNSGVDLKDIVAICIGTGFMANWIGSDTAQWGAHQWLNGVESKDDTDHVPALLINEAGSSPILNLCLNGTSTSLIPMLCEMLLPGRYVYLNPVLNYTPENAYKEEQLHYLSSRAKEFPVDHPETWEKAKSLLSAYW